MVVQLNLDQMDPIGPVVPRAPRSNSQGIFFDFFTPDENNQENDDDTIVEGYIDYDLDSVNGDDQLDQMYYDGEEVTSFNNNHFGLPEITSFFSNTNNLFTTYINEIGGITPQGERSQSVFSLEENEENEDDVTIVNDFDEDNYESDEETIVIGSVKKIKKSSTLFNNVRRLFF